MKLSRNGKLHAFYDWTYDRYAPDNLCTFFWKLLFAVLIFPLTWLSHPFKCDGVGERIAKSLLMLICLITLGGVMGATLVGFYLPAAIIGGVFVSGFVVLFLIGIAFLAWNAALWLIALGKRPFGDDDTAGEILEVIKARKNAFKDRFCPRIDWRF